MLTVDNKVGFIFKFLNWVISRCLLSVMFLYQPKSVEKLKIKHWMHSRESVSMIDMFLFFLVKFLSILQVKISPDKYINIFLLNNM